MSVTATPWWDVTRWLPEDATRRQLVIFSAGGLIAAQILLRGWAIYGAWFYSDDFILLEDAGRRSLTLNFLFTPHDSHLMPPGMLITWIVAHSGPYNWALAATITLVLQVAASAGCLLMLSTLFGWRYRILAPLALYLFSTLSLDGVIWWAAALNALPLHIGFFVAVTGAVRYFRSHQLPDLLVALAGVCLSLLADPRGLLTLVSLGLLAMWFFADGTWWRRPFVALSRWWMLWVPALAALAAYVIAYRQLVPSPVNPGASTDISGTANTMFGTSFATAVFGGPWHWDKSNPPMGIVDPPTVLRWTAVVALIGLVAYVLRRSPWSSLGAVAILGTHLLITFAGMAFGRATQIGAGAGLLMRFLSDVAPVVALTVGLAILPMAGASCVPRASRRQTGRKASVATVVAFALVIGGAVASSVLFAQSWRSYPARTFVINATESLQRDPAVIADVEVPELVQAATAYPYNLPSRLLAPFDDLQTATSGNDLRVLDEDGFHRQAEVPAFIAAAPGPRPQCGYPITSSATMIELPSRNNAAFWWLTLSYVAGAPAEIEVLADGRLVGTIDIQPGAHTYFIQGENPFNEVSLRAILSGTGACIDRITVGDEIVPRK